MKLQDKTVVITGAGSGIGQALCHELVREGCHVAIVDRDSRGLERTMEKMPKSENRISKHIMDLTDKQSCSLLLEKILMQHPSVDVLINNAGISAFGKFQRLDECLFNKVMDLNFHAPVRLIRSFLPHLRSRPEALIVNMCSIFGYIASPARSAYVAGKFALRGFSNSLRLELEKSNVHVVTVFPVGAATNIASSAGAMQNWSTNKRNRLSGREEKLLRMSPDYVAKKVVLGIKRNRQHLLIGSDARIAFIIERIFPGSYWKKLQVLIHLKMNENVFLRKQK
jgi:short-subunit dehydrogenase